MAKNKKPTKSLLNEDTVRRFMKLADIPELSDSFVNEEWGTKKDEESKTKKGEEDYTTKKGEEKKTSGKKRGTKKGDEAYKNESLYSEDEHEEEELHATEDELGAEDEIADEEGAELDAEAGGEGEAEITPEAAQAIVDLAASLEASGALAGAEAEVEGEEEIEAGAEDIEAGAEEEELAEFRGLEEQLAKLGIEVVDVRRLKEAVYKRVIRRLTNEHRRVKKVRQTDRLVERIFARLQKESKKR